MVGQVSASQLPRRSRYTLADVADLVIELHSCVEKAATDISATRTELGAHTLEVTKEIGKVCERVATLEGQTQAVSQRVGVDTNKDVQKPAWYLKPWQIVSGACAAVGGFVVLYKIAAAVIPALNHAILAQ